MNPYWVTFYSYKGGVGRTLALVNAAALLSQQGRRILLVDFDLEAPGLDSFSELGITLGQPGVVEYFSDFANTAKAPPLREYIQQPDVSFAKENTFWVMASGRKDREYNRQRDLLNWSELYDTGLGELMIAEWKATISATFQPDYVFVDSRTGLTDVGGVCTLHLPDLVVALFALNRQNIDGVSSVINAIERAETKRHPHVVTVATPVPAVSTDDRIVFEALSGAQAVLNRKIDLRISYSPAAALTERIFVIKNAELRRSFLIEYRDLVDRIKTLNTEGLDGLLKKAESARESDNEAAALSIAADLQRDFSDRADAILEMAEINRRFVGREPAVEMWERAFQLDNTLAAAFEPLVNYYKAKGNYERVVELCDRLSNRKKTDGSGIAIEAQQSKAEALMALGQPGRALECYKLVLDAGSTGLEDKFNAAEAIRRATRQANGPMWDSVVELYEKRRQRWPVNMEANIAQAMHVAYACRGDLLRARQLLQNATELATSAAGTIFSVTTYKFVSKEKFLDDVNKCKQALDKGQLWDGMSLPAAMESPQGNPQIASS
jgi:MinD-like ATPase involved in chromosome partitioning or flagellar assembly